MSPRAVKVTITLLIVATLLAIAYVVVPRVGMGHRNIDTAGKIIYLLDAEGQGKPHVWIANHDGTGMRDLTPGRQICADPSFSPDGSQIAYVSDKQGQPQIYIMDADGKHPHRVTYGSASKSSPQFSPDGRSLTFLAQGTVTSIDLQSNDTQPLLPSPDLATSSSTAALIDISHAPVVSYSWSPIKPSDSGRDPEIAAVQESDDPDEEVLTLLTSPTSAPKELFAAASISFCWSPDGDQLYAAILGGHVGPQNTPFSGIITFGADGTPVQKPPIAASNSLAIGPSDPTVSPDGTQICFTVVNNPDLAHNQILGIFLQPLDGSAPPKALIRGPAIGAQWSPDGSRILVLLPQRGEPGHDLWVAALSGSNPPLDLTAGAGNVTSAEWSPSLPKPS